MSSRFKKKWKKFLEPYQPTRNSFFEDKCETLQQIKFLIIKYLTVKAFDEMKGFKIIFGI
jgi:hypothetical protein